LTCTDVSQQDLLPVATSGGWISAAVYCMRRNNLPTFQPLVPADSFVKPCHCNRGLARAAWSGYCEVRTGTGVVECEDLYCRVNRTENQKRVNACFFV
jgi:hypothetical protein